MNQTLTSPKGFLAAGVKCGIKASKQHDLGLIVCPTGAKAAGVFTTNKIVSASVVICKEHIKSRSIEAVVVNSGNANTCTGKQGIKDAIAMCKTVASEIESDPHSVLIASTGIIGEKLPISKVLSGITNAAETLGADEKSGFDFAQSILTTDTKVKQAATEFKIGNKRVTIAGTSKGAGMIGPNMATTLCFLTTDVNISKPLLQKAISRAIGESLNKLTVDGHQSTNDTALILTSSMAGNKIIKSQDANYKKFEKALCAICNSLAREMALDAEGATKMFKVLVKGAKTQTDAEKAARAVADYDLVKCAVNGSDPNWGRIICAVGSCGVELNPDKLSCKLDNIAVFRNGTPVNFDRDAAQRVLEQKEHTITIDLGIGKKSDFCYGCDLSHGYITINADYHT